MKIFFWGICGLIDENEYGFPRMMVGGYSDGFSTTSLLPVDVIHQITAGDISYQKKDPVKSNYPTRVTFLGF